MEKICWRKWFNFGIDNFGKSAPYKDVYKHFGLTSENIIKEKKK